MSSYDHSRAERSPGPCLSFSSLHRSIPFHRSPSSCAGTALKQTATTTTTTSHQAEQLLQLSGRAQIHTIERTVSCQSAGFSVLAAILHAIADSRGRCIKSARYTHDGYPLSLETVCVLGNYVRWARCALRYQWLDNRELNDLLEEEPDLGSACSSSRLTSSRR
ncbi:hypothetical protein K466DRAFT_116409 [Polyporus arcularius HHB13444]|uniref:Uncharacterized protein n=1 Tax=Polyporus arcularius HHB13444 TaxID=1314778 RepID=A0A5C3PCG8_9APHY|nr:hypothetical protein K466DRAFT_116409 [Polyporus arcularius HHB13444]